jgi:hypothetical protein
MIITNNHRIDNKINNVFASLFQFYIYSFYPYENNFHQVCEKNFCLKINKKNHIG